MSRPPSGRRTPGIAVTGYYFYLSTKPYTWADVDLGIPGWSADPQAIQITLVLAIAAWLALPIPVLTAGLIRLRAWRPRNWLRAAAWAGAWIAGFALTYQAIGWGQYPGSNNWPTWPRTSHIPSPAVVSWGELAICAAWLVLGAMLTWILAGPAHRPDVLDASDETSVI